MSELDYVLPSDGSDDAVNEEPSEEIDHVAQGLRRLYLQFKKPHIEALVVILMTPVQEAHEMLMFVMLNRDVETAVGKILDTVGKRVGQPRTSADDEIYRRHIRARIIVNRSKGTVSDVIKVVRAVLGPDSTAVVKITEQYPAGIMVTIESEIDAGTAEILGDLLPKTVSGGVRVQLVYTLFPIEETFRFGLTPGFGFGHLGGSI